MLAAIGALLRGRLIARGRARAVRTAQMVDLLVLGGAGPRAWPDCPSPGPPPGGALLGAVATLAVWLNDRRRPGLELAQ